MSEKYRHKIAHILFALSSMCKALGKLVITRERTILVDALSLPGWFVLDECMIHQVPLDFRCLKNGFEWSIYPMPGEWCEMMQNLKRKI